MNSTGNGTTGITTRRPTALPDLVYPNLLFDESDYASLRARLDLYDSFILMTHYQNGRQTQQHLVNPTDLATALSGISLTSTLLPPHTLFWGRLDGAERIAVYLDPRLWLVTIRDQPLAWRVPLPGLIFVGHDYNYSLYAVKEPPTRPDLPLFRAPVANVSDKGVCRGSAPFPKAGAATLYQAIDVFFASKFNRDLANGKSHTYRDNILDHWQALNDAGAEEYPLSDLVETQLTLGGLLKNG